MAGNCDGIQLIKLQSNDDKLFEVPVKAACLSKTVATMLENLGLNENEAPIPVPKVNADILQRVMDYCIYHKDDPPPPEEDRTKEKRSDDISEWDVKFLEVDQGTLFELILAANFMDVQGLLDAACKTVANMIKGKTAVEIRKMFNIINDFSAEEEAQVIKENEWCQER